MNIRIVAVAFTLCVSRCALAQQDEPSQVQEQQNKPEEILITGERALRLQMISAEKHAYDVFNQFNDERRFNISCSLNAPTGSRLEKQICQPEFEIEATAAHAVDLLDSLRLFLDPTKSSPVGNGVNLHPSMEVEIARQLPEYKRKIKQVAEQHPEFLQAIKQYAGLRKQYEGAIGAAKKPD